MAVDLAPPTSAPSEVDGFGAPARMPVRRWRNLAAITGVEVVDNAEAGLVNTLFPAIATSLSLSSAHLGVLTAVGKCVAVPFGPAWVWLAGRIGRKAAIVATTVSGGVFGALAGFAGDFVALLALNTLMSVCLAGGQPIANAIVADAFPDGKRSIATGYLYGAMTMVSALIGPLLALLTGTPDGWRIGMWVIGGVSMLSGLLIVAFYRDPPVGASEPQLAGLPAASRSAPVTVGSVVSLFRIPSFSIMMTSRLLSGHLLLAIFGVQFLVSERGFSNATAAIVLVPFGFAFAAGTIGAGFFVAWLDRVWTHTGRVVFIQSAQVAFAVVAFFGTQFVYDGIAAYAGLWALLGLCQGLNPPVNRPIVMSVVLPELRGQAFAIFLSVVQTLAWAAFALLAAWLSLTFSLQDTFLWVLVVLMLLNALLLSALYATYPADVARVTHELERRRAEYLGVA